MGRLEGARPTYVPTQEVSRITEKTTTFRKALAQTFSFEKMDEGEEKGDGHRVYIMLKELRIGATFPYYIRGGKNVTV